MDWGAMLSTLTAAFVPVLPQFLGIVAFLVLLSVALALLTPQVADHDLDRQASAARYLEGGIRLLNTLLRTHEVHRPALEKAHLA